MYTGKIRGEEEGTEPEKLRELFLLQRAGSEVKEQLLNCPTRRARRQTVASHRQASESQHLKGGSQRPALSQQPTWPVEVGKAGKFHSDSCSKERSSLTLKS